MGNGSVEPATAPVQPQQEHELPQLPWRVPLDPAPWWAWALFVLPFVAVPALNSWLWMGARDMLAVGLLTIIGASVVRVAGGVVLYRVELFPTGLKARTSMLIRSLAWQDVGKIEIGEDSVVLTRGPDEHEINGIRKDRTAEVAAVMEALRERSLTSRVRRHRPRPGIGTLLVLLYVVLSIGAFMLRWHLVI
ncbi:hypothetical protein GCM10009630_37910 [Kribbella jejuensis]|uniref:Uncharacterized protein n=1 Tax=Kribbella jejuensis TaxID=236068 RepID=A0A542ESV3_9ACTN|nr:hypothetical protein [Kribbella jejuensis]TQJ18256.1 hypothetical protein FB475_2391 [Kribbella jejuensis]